MSLNSFVLIFVSLFLLTVESQARETRCGWIENPTPGNIWMLDAHGMWVVSQQGGHSAEGNVEFPRSDDHYVYTNINKGYFCGCLVGEFNDSKDPYTVEKIEISKVLSLNVCLKDRNLNQDYRPRKKIASSGKAYAECQREDELEIGFKRRRACVNQPGEYYFLAD